MSQQRQFSLSINTFKFKKTLLTIATRMLSKSLHIDQKMAHFRFLEFADRERIKRELELALPAVEFNVFAEYQFNFGISDTQDNTYFIYGIDENMSHIIGDFQIEEDTMYSQSTISDFATLRVPSVVIDEFGLSSGEALDYKVSLKSGVYERNPLNLYGKKFEKIMLEVEHIRNN